MMGKRYGFKSRWSEHQDGETFQEVGVLSRE